MSTRLANFPARAGGVALVAMLAIFAGTSAKADPGPFSGFAGSWSGTGTIKVSNGSNERIRCRVSYSVSNAGNSVSQSLRCASDSYRFDVTSNISYSGGRVTGNWSETTRSVGGNINGRASGGRIQATVLGSAFTAGISMSTSGNTQSVTITPRGKTDVQEVSITLQKK